MKPCSPEEGYQWAANRCSVSEQCRHDIGEKLRQRGLTAVVCAEICDRLEDEGFIDERRYTRAFVHDKYMFNAWGRLKIVQALRMRGISGTWVKEILDEVIDEEEYQERLRELMSRKSGTREQKMRFAASRGFEPYLIYNIAGED